MVALEEAFEAIDPPSRSSTATSTRRSPPRSSRRRLRRAGRARGGRAAQLRRHDARGDQPAGHRPAVRPAVRDQPRGRRQPRADGRPRRADPLRRQPDDRHPAGQPRPVRRRQRSGRASACPSRTRSRRMHRPANVDDPGRAAARSSPCSGRSPTSCPLVLPLHPRGRPDARGGRPRRRRPAAGHRAARLHRLHLARPGGGGRRHRLGRDPGGDDGPRRAVPDRPAEHRAADHDHPRHEPPRDAGRRRACSP